MSVVRVTWKDREVRDAIARMRARRGSFQPVFAGLKKYLRLTLKQYAAMGKSPDGKWPARAQSTKERYEFATSQRKSLRGRQGPVQRKAVRRRSGKLLGRLPSAVTIRATKRGIAAVSKVPWSAAQNEGARVGRGANLPKREFVFISPAFGQIAADRMADYVVREFGR